MEKVGKIKKVHTLKHL